MDIMRSLRNMNEGVDSPKQAGTLAGAYRPQTISEMLDAQILFYESKIADLKAAKGAISPEVEKALNALAKIS